MELTDIERQTLANFLAAPGPVRTALHKFAAAQLAHHNGMASQSMRTIPRALEAACDHAAKAECYANLMEDLRRFAAKS